MLCSFVACLNFLLQRQGQCQRAISNERTKKALSACSFLFCKTLKYIYFFLKCAYHNSDNVGRLRTIYGNLLNIARRSFILFCQLVLEYTQNFFVKNLFLFRLFFLYFFEINRFIAIRIRFYRASLWLCGIRRQKIKRKN